MEHPRIPVYLLIDAEYQICEYNTFDRILTLSSFPQHMTTALTCLKKRKRLVSVTIAHLRSLYIAVRTNLMQPITVFSTHANWESSFLA